MIRKLLLALSLGLTGFIVQAQTNGCAGAPVLTVNNSCINTAYVVPGSFTNSNAPLTCGATVNRDGWFSFTTPAGATQISIQGTASVNLGLALYSGPCLSPSEISCVTPGAVTANLNNVPVTGNTTYYLRIIRTANGGNSMNGNICVINTTPACNTPTLNATTGVTANAATISWAPPAPAPAGYEYVVSTVNTPPGGAGTATANTSENITGLTPGTTYYVFVRSNCGGSFSGWVGPDTFTTASGLANDDCAGAIGLTVNADQSCTSTTSGTINGATDSGENNCGGTEDDDIWYSFVATATAHTIDLINISGGTTDLYHAVYAGNCGALGAPIVCSDPNSSTATGLTIGNTYYVQVYSWTSASGQTTNFDICIGTPPPPPSNDECANAIGLTVNPDQSCTSTTSGTIQSATDSGEDNCGGTEDDDVWYSFVATGTVHTVDLINVAGSTTNLNHAVYAGGCGTLGAALVCSDPNTSSISGLTVGNTYYVQVYSSTSTAGQNTTFDICIGTPPPAPANDDPCNATAVGTNPDQLCTVFGSGTIYNATDSGITGSGCFGTDNDDVWFSFVATSTAHTFELFNISGSTSDLYHAVYAGTCSAPGAAILCSDPNTSSVSGLTVGNTYYVQVYSWDSTSGQTSSFDICIGTPPPPPSNDSCSGAISLTADVTCNYVTYTNESALDSGVANPGCASYSGGDVWFSVVVPPSGEITVDTQAGVVTDSGLALYSGNCGSLTLLDCDDDGGTGLMSSITQSGLTPGETVYIRFWEFGNNNNGDFGICVTTPIFGTNGVNICPGDPSESLTTDIACSASGTTTLGSSYTGTLNAGSDPVAARPLIFIESTDPCGFATNTSNYTSVNFSVSVTGTYIFTMEEPVPFFDGMGYIVVNDGLFVPGSCATGTWIAGDDDSGLGLNPVITANLTAGVNYTLYTTKYSSSSSTSHTGDFTWTITTPPVQVEWYTTPTGGSPIGSGSIFDPVGVPGSGLADTNTPGVWSYYTGCPGSSDPREQADFVIGKVWNGSVDNDWYDANNWTPNEVPTVSDCVIIPNVAIDPVIFGVPPIPPPPALARNLIVLSNGNLEITNNRPLQVIEAVSVDPAGTLIIRDGGSLVQIDDTAVNSGNIRMERTVSGLSAAFDDDYIYWSSPVENFPVTNISPGTPNDFIWEWIPTIGNNFGNWQNSSENMVQGKGYIVRDVEGTATAFTPLFVGVPNNGVIAKQINRGTYTGPDYAGPGDTMVTAQDDNWNLVGNPYPSSVSYTEFIAANPYIDGTIHLWTHQTAPSAINSPFYQDFAYNYSPNDYIDNNYTGSNPPGFNGYIAAGQSFFVQMLEAPTTSQSEVVTFNNSMRDATYSNMNFYGANPDGVEQISGEPEKHRMWFDLITPLGEANSILIGYVEGATDGDDRLYDGYEFPGNGASFYSLSGNKKMSIQGLALPFENTDQIGLGYQAPFNGNYQIAINTLDGLFTNDDQDIYLVDDLTGKVHDLRQSPYEFYSSEGQFENRFGIRFTLDTLSDDEHLQDELLIISVNKNLIVSSSSNPIDRIRLIDLLGRPIFDQRVDNLRFEKDLSLISRSAYIVQVDLADGRRVNKRIVN